MSNKEFTCPFTGRKAYLRMYVDSTFYFWHTPRNADPDGRRPTKRKVEDYYRRLKK